jgi:hypothetical protein
VRDDRVDERSGNDDRRGPESTNLANAERTKGFTRRPIPTPDE